MDHSYWNNLNFSWGWLIWFGFVFILFSSLGNWGSQERTRSIFSAKGMPVAR